MNKKVLLMTAVLGGTMLANGQEVFMATGAEGVNHIDFQSVKTLSINSFDEGKTVFAKKMLFPQQAEPQNCNCDLNSPNYIAALAIDSEGNFLALNMTGTMLFKHLQNGDVQMITVQEIPETVSEQNLFARMTTAQNGDIYALNNAGSQLIKVAKSGEISLLGEVEGFAQIFRNFSDTRNSFGGDMIADDAGNLLVITAFGNVVKIVLPEISAEYLGQISGLPDGYTVNGVAVTSDNMVLLASSQPRGLYTVDLSSLTASYFGENKTPTYDLASANFFKSSLLPSGEGLLALTPTLLKQQRTLSIASPKSFADAQILVYAADGKLMLHQTKSIKSGDNTVNVNGLSSGVYVVSVLNSAGKNILTEKITVE